MKCLSKKFRATAAFSTCTSNGWLKLHKKKPGERRGRQSICKVQFNQKRIINGPEDLLFKDFQSHKIKMQNHDVEEEWVPLSWQFLPCCDTASVAARAAKITSSPDSSSRRQKLFSSQMRREKKEGGRRNTPFHLGRYTSSLTSA